MDLNQIIAQASAPHMQRIGSALDELRAAIQSAQEAGFRFRLKFVEPTEQEVPDPSNALNAAVRARAVEAFLDTSAQPVLEYKATIQESPTA